MYNVFEKQSDVKVAHAQVVYLKEVLNKGYDEISKITQYAVSTCKSYVRKFNDLLDWAKEIFEEKQKKKYRKSKYDEMINENSFDIRDNKGQELCYLFRFFDSENNLICSKVGTTTRTIRTRLIEELRSKTYKAMGAVYAVVDRIYNCNGIPAEGLESRLRAEYIKKYPDSFKKNDRFINQIFDLNFCDKIASEYLS